MDEGTHWHSPSYSSGCCFLLGATLPLETSIGQFGGTTPHQWENYPGELPGPPCRQSLLQEQLQHYMQEANRSHPPAMEGLILLLASLQHSREDTMGAGSA